MTVPTVPRGAAPARPLILWAGVGLLAVSLAVSGCARRTTTTTTTTFAPATATATAPRATRTERQAERRTASAPAADSSPSAVASAGSTAADATGSTVSAAARNASGGGSARASLVIPAGLAVAALGIAQVEQDEEVAQAAAYLPPGVPSENLRIGDDRCYYYILPDGSGGLGRVIGPDGAQMCI